MDEKLKNLTTEENIETYPVDMVESEIGLEDLEENIEIEETLDLVEVESTDEIEIELDEAVGWIGGDSTRHYSLSGRDEPNQHPIEAIIGLRTELDKIEALQTVYSDSVGSANFYKWNTGAYDEVGYFVSIVPKTSTIQICYGTDIFGVTVDRAGFIGGQNADVPHNNTYALVVTSGFVDVRCESDVNVGDYVISNTQGVATKTTSGCGYKVVAINNKHGVNYASIVLGVQACTTDAIGRNVQHIQTRLDDAEINIAAAMNVANAAYNKSIDSDTIAEEVKKQMKDTMDKVDNIEGIVDSANESVASTSVIAAQAKAIAESATTSAESFKDEAVAKANDAWAKADEVATEVHSLCANIDRYSVGEYSQANGLTLEQVRSILKEGMVYIPTASHIETYADGVDYSFTYTFYYVWTGIMWTEGVGEVWFSKEQPAGAAYTYWYDGASLFILQDEQWVEVATLAGNINNRITSMIRQDVSTIALDIANAGGSVAGLNVRLADTESKINSYAYWPTDENEYRFNLSTIDQSANKDGSSLALAVVDKNGEQILRGATIVLNQNDNGSSISLDADYINFNTGTFKLNASYIDLDGYATINDGFSIDENGYMHATKGGTVGGFAIKDSSLHTNNKIAYNSTTTGVYIGTDGIGLGAGKFYVTKDGHLTVKSGTIGGCQIDANGNLQIKNINIAEELVAKSILVKDQWNNTLLSAGNGAVSIAGWNVDNNSFYSGATFDTSTCFICTGSTGNPIKVAGVSSTGWVFKAGEHFGVKSDGSMYCTSGTFEGNLTAKTGGQIGGWTISSDLCGEYTYPEVSQSGATFKAKTQISPVKVTFAWDTDGDGVLNPPISATWGEIIRAVRSIIDGTPVSIDF